jgi:hypothetical protein
MPQQNNGEIVDVPSDVLERLQGDSKAVRELLEKQDLEARDKEEKALKQAELDLHTAEQKAIEDKKIADELAVKEAEEKEAEKTEISEYRASVLKELESINKNGSNSLTAVSLLDEKLISLDENLKLVEKTVSTVEKPTEFQENSSAISFYADVAIVFICLILVPIWFGFKLVKPIVNHIF